MFGLIVTPERLTRDNISERCMNISQSDVVADFRRHQLKNWCMTDEEFNIYLGAMIGLRLKKIYQKYA